MIKNITFINTVFDYDNKHNMECLSILDKNSNEVIGTIYFDNNFGIEEFLKNYAIVKIERKVKEKEN